MNKKVSLYSDTRVLCTLLVVIGHCTSLTLVNKDGISNIILLNSVQVYTEFLRTVIYSFHMPLFVSLSGAVFSYTYNEKQPFSLYVKKKTRRLLVPFLTTALLILVPQRYITGYYQGQSLGAVIGKDILLAYDVNYLWYLLMLFEVSVLFFFVAKRFLDNSKRELLIFFLLFGTSFASFALPQLPFQINKTAEFSFWFYIGMVIDRNRNILKNSSREKNIYLLFLAWFLLFVLHGGLENFISATKNPDIVFAVKLIKMAVRYMMETAAVLFVYLTLANHPMKNTGPYRIIEKYSMQVYLFHAPIIHIYKYCLGSFLANNTISNALYILLLVVGICIAVSLAVLLSYIGSKVKIQYTRYVFKGEGI